MNEPKDSTKDRLNSFIERIERLQEEKRGTSEDIKHIYSEAKASGFEVAIMRQVIRLRKMAANDRQEQKALINTYMKQLETA